MSKILVALPAILFGVFAALAWRGLGGDNSVETAFAGRPAPAMTVERLEEYPLLTAEALAEGVPIYGINYKDPNGASFLERLGNPFRAIGADPTGRTGLDWGVRAMPETFLIGDDGRVVERITGIVTPALVDQIIARASETGAPD